MKKGLTELVFILDKSGSMSGKEEDVVGGFNSMIKKQQKEDGDAIVSTVLFSDERSVIHDRVDIMNLKPMTENDYEVGGCTALVDAIGCSVHHIQNVHKYIREEDIPEHTLFIITTDGLENASMEYSSDEVKSLIEEKKESGWEFLFMAANIDAVETAKHFGIDRDCAIDYKTDKAGIRFSTEIMCNAVSLAKAGKKINIAKLINIAEEEEM